MERPEAFLGGFDLTPLISYYTRGFFSAEKKVQGFLSQGKAVKVSTDTCRNRLHPMEID